MSQFLANGVDQVGRCQEAGLTAQALVNGDPAKPQGDSYRCADQGEHERAVSAHNQAAIQAALAGVHIPLW